MRDKEEASKPKRDIRSLSDVRCLVDSFYSAVREDPLIGPVFEKMIGNHWESHLKKMYSFWQTVLLGEHTYYGSPFGPHSRLSLEPKHFERWLTLFGQTIDRHFEGEKAEEAMWRARKMAAMFQHKIEYYRSHPEKKPLR